MSQSPGNAGGSSKPQWTPSVIDGSTVVPMGRGVGLRADLTQEKPRSNTRPLVIWGCTLVFLMFGCFGLWAATVPLGSAVIAPGVVKVSTQRRAVQHLEGGIVKSLLVREGDQVERGQVVARLDTTQIEANLGVLTTQLFADLAMEARLEAEQMGNETLTFPDELRLSPSSEARLSMQTQLAEFTARAASRQGERKLIDQQILQLEDSIRGIASSSRGLEQQLAYIRDEIADSDYLLARGLARKPRVLALKRSEADLQAQIGKNVSSVAEARGKIAELEDRRRQIDYNKLEDIAKQRHTTREEIADLRHRTAAARDMLARSELKAPERGIVVGLNTTNTNAVLGARETLLEIVPLLDRLTLEGQVKPPDRDEIHVGQPARVRVLAFNTRRAPMLVGVVTTISADALVEPRSGKPYYKTEVELQSTPELASYISMLQPGMPVEVFIETGQRTFAQYLLQPLMLHVHRAFKES